MYLIAITQYVFHALGQSGVGFAAMKYSYIIACIMQFPDNIRSDEACTADYQDIHIL